MTGPARVAAWITAGLVFLFVMVTAWLPGGLELWLVPVKGGQPLMVLPLDVAERFTLHYYHSVENAPIWEEHSIDEDGRIFIEEERYAKFGAGMGRMPGVGRMVTKGPYEAIVDMHMPTGDFVLRIGSPGVDHTIIWRGTRTNLSCMAPHTAVQFSARPVSRLHKLWRNIKPHPATPVLE